MHGWGTSLLCLRFSVKSSSCGCQNGICNRRQRCSSWQLCESGFDGTRKNGRICVHLFRRSALQVTTPSFTSYKHGLAIRQFLERPIAYHTSKTFCVVRLRRSVRIEFWYCDETTCSPACEQGTAAFRAQRSRRKSSCRD